MDRSRDLLGRHLQLMDVRDHKAIRTSFDDVRNIRNGLENFNGSGLRMLHDASEYRRLAKIAYRIVKRASDRAAVEGRLMDQIADAVQHGDGSGSGHGTASVPRNPFTSPHAISTLTDVAVSDLDRVEMSTYQARDTGEGAVVLDVIGRDESVQHIVASFQTDVFSGVRTDRAVPEAPAALSLHPEDGTMPRFIFASLSDLSQDQEETHSLYSISTITSSELFGTSEAQ
ncbi:hypothetical protein BJV77DRAFT_1070447 [Russula vinacea]|nr:hypothetical protein BJV77DRAFT_1070447 [Russula vinacea]